MLRSSRAMVAVAAWPAAAVCAAGRSVRHRYCQWRAAAPASVSFPVPSRVGDCQRLFPRHGDTAHRSVETNRSGLGGFNDGGELRLGTAGVQGRLQLRGQHLQVRHPQRPAAPFSCGDQQASAAPLSAGRAVASACRHDAVRRIAGSAAVAGRLPRSRFSPVSRFRPSMAASRA